MKASGEIFPNEFSGYIEFCLSAGDIRIRTDKLYSTPSSARRAAKRVAKRLGLEVEWKKEGRE